MRHRDGEHDALQEEKVRNPHEDLDGQVFDYPRLLKKYTPQSPGPPPGIFSLGIGRFLANSVHQTKMKACNTYTLTSQKKTVFEAIVTLMKAQRGLVDYTADRKEQFLPGSYFHSILFTYVVVVFDGPIFEANV